jgi:hypothetical protein
MGWASGLNYCGETVGYGHPTVCSETGCDESIDKGLAYTCGGLEGVEGEAGCGRHFCGSHLYRPFPFPDEEDDPRFDVRDENRENAALCSHCTSRWEKGLYTGMEDISWMGDIDG